MFPVEAERNYLHYLHATCNPLHERDGRHQCDADQSTHNTWMIRRMCGVSLSQRIASEELYHFKLGTSKLKLGTNKLKLGNQQTQVEMSEKYRKLNSTENILNVKRKVLLIHGIENATFEQK